MKLDGHQHRHWCFISEERRDEYLRRAIARGLQVKRATVPGNKVQRRYIADANSLCSPDAMFPGLLYTVVDIDQRVGK